ncbi:MAG TPA: DUF4350 domain-containing protein [Longimicrobium sp.]|nr:DUF4350 domain-containing protein [Longimicrobium sp.]
MRSRRDTWILAALIGLIVLLAVLAGSRRRDVGNDPRPSTFVSAPLGASALRQVLQELKQPLARRLEPFADAGPLHGPLAVLSPSEPPSPGEVHALAEWVRGGGTLIYAARRGDPTLDSLRLKLHTLARDTGYAELLDRGRAATVAAGPLTQGVGVVDGFRRGFEPASASLNHATVLASAGSVPVVLDFRFGKGRVIAWSDAYPLVNHTLKDSRAAILFARTAADAAKGGTLWFDEYHHGFSEGGGTLAGATRFLARQAAGHAALQVTVALLGLLLLFGRRFGAPLPPPPSRRRSPLEHVEALAGAYRQARAAATARRLLMAGLARRLGRRVPRETKAEGELLQRLVAHPTAGDAARALEAEWKKGGGADLVALSRDVDRYLEEVVKT